MTLRDDALKLAQLDQHLVRAVVEGDDQGFASLAAEYMSLRRSLKNCLLDIPAISEADDIAADVLRKISTGDGLSIDKLLERLIGEPGVLDRLDDDAVEQLGSELFYSWYSHWEYVESLAELRPLILRVSVPDSVSHLVQMVKYCYAFQQYDAAYALCRTVIEASVRDICVRRELFPNLGNNVFRYEERKWSTLRDKVTSGQLQNRLRDLYHNLSELVHGRKSVTREEARATFEETLQIVEEMYAQNGL